ncbi:ent-kaurene synthase TSP4, chloroplastic [Macadamia integrifolia]|uniref:ent-kaurene synthase TSP4, chloroplastic n=1 Tax=Macadamia integrifolia TaxID=60698 RepID=UPI001C52D471|nr:ent-kaurene synthase TSP4, chloroplastic [Macadamia integrifolia]
MSLSYPRDVLLNKSRRWRSSSVSVSLDAGLKIAQISKDATVCFQGPKERIKELFSKVELSVSSYDTAWVAMVPSPSSPQYPYFPKCVTWLLENQLPDGSWGLPHSKSMLIKDALSSTLACVLALKRWNAGEEHVKKGIHFIVSNFASATNEKQHSPIGFDIIFPGMIDYAKDIGLNIPLSPSILDSLLCKRHLEFKRASTSCSERRKAYLAYVAEGLGKLQDWNEVMKYQRENGSLFNSPSTTAAAFIHFQDANCLNYLHSVLERFGDAVPTTYPSDTYTRLCMVDILVGLGIDRHFRDEIKVVLDETYRYWLQGDDEIFLDPATCAMAFRILRINGYDVPSDALAQFDEDHYFCDPLIGHMGDINAPIELYKASEIMISNEPVLENLNFFLSRYLKQGLSNDSLPVDGVHIYTSKETFHWRHIYLNPPLGMLQVEYTLGFPHYASLERLQSRSNIENYNVNSLRILKTAYRSLNISNRNFLQLAMEDFNFCQEICRKELQHLELWVKENKLDKLKFARQKLVYCYFSGAATLFSPELSDARMAWAKNGVLTTVVDDFFDDRGSKEELVNLIELVEKWDGSEAAHFCSEQVQIIYSALYNTINELGNKAFAWQQRTITSNIIEIWLSLLNSMMEETEWARNNLAPTIDEYMTNGYVSIALGPIVLPALYFVGPELSEEVVNSTEYYNLYKLMSTCGRLLNDVQGFKREAEQGKLNGVFLRMMHSCSGNITKEEAIKEIRAVIVSNRRQLLKLVLKREGSVVPRACKDVFWKMSKILHLFYMRNDGFTSPTEMVNYVNAVIYDPINLI